MVVTPLIRLAVCPIPQALPPSVIVTSVIPPTPSTVILARALIPTSAPTNSTLNTSPAAPLPYPAPELAILTAVTPFSP